LLGKRNGWRPEDMLAVQKDVYSAYGRAVARAVAAAYDRRGGPQEVADAAAVLRSWDGQMEKDEAAPVLIALLTPRLRKAAGESASPGNGARYGGQMSYPVIAKLLEERPAGWFADYDAVLVQALADAVAEGRKEQGADVAGWKYGRHLQLTIRNRIAGQIPVLGRLFNIGPVPMSGAPTAVKQTTERIGPSMRMAADMGDLDRSLLNIPVGQSGQILSTHYKDEWESYYYGHSFPMQFGKVDAREVLTMLPGT
jgi:penicillin amidase